MTYDSHAYPPWLGSLRALVVDDDGATRALTARWLAEFGIETIHAQSGEEALAIAHDNPSALGAIILDLMMPEMSGYEVLGRLKHTPDLREIPVILLTAHADGDADVVRGIEGGAEDFVNKPFRGTVLVAKVRALMARRRALMQMRARLERAEQLATTDPLTALANRREFEHQLEREVAYTRRHRAPLSLLIVDIDHFKIINDAYGHPLGDRVLVQIAQRISDSLRMSDHAFRIGGEEFAVILRGTDQAAGLFTGERLVKLAHGQPVMLGDGRELAVTLSVGVAAADEANGFDTSRLVERADAALYAAKRGGRDTAVLESSDGTYA